MPKQLPDTFIHLVDDAKQPLFTTIYEHKTWNHPRLNQREPNRDFDTHIDVRNPQEGFMIRKRRSTYLQVGLNDDNRGSFATSATTIVEEAGVTKEACSMADWWWRDETTTVWKKEPLRSATMVFENGRKKNGRCFTRKRRTMAQFL